MALDINSLNPALTGLQQTDQTQGVGALLSGGQLLGTGATSTASGAAGDSARISGLGKLFAELQALQSQDPAKFKSVLTDISTQLQNAAKQVTGGQADFLTKLADQFQTAANTGDLSSLRPAHHGHGHHAHATYNAQGQVVPQATPPDNSAATPDLKQIFDNIIQTVSQALAT
jgi:hypothetical protein